MAGTFRVSSEEYTVSGTIGELPVAYSAMLEHAVLHDDFGLKGLDGTILVVSVERASERWPSIIVSQRFEPSSAGFNPGVILVQENHLLLVGAGTRLLAYDLDVRRRLWEDAADVGFWGWKHHGDIVVMSAELELAAWDLQGNKLWSTFVEPPWDYEVRDTQLVLDVMGKKSSFNARTGPANTGGR